MSKEENKKIKGVLEDVKKTNAYCKGYIDGWKARSKIADMSEEEKVRWAKKVLLR